METAIQQLKQAAFDADAILRECAPGHWQIIKGQRVVNYYPLSKRMTAFVDRETVGRKYMTPAQAVALAVEAPGAK